MVFELFKNQLKELEFSNTESYPEIACGNFANFNFAIEYTQ
jgi:hypothetical protein